MNHTIELDLEPETAIALLMCLHEATKGYGQQHVPERVERLRGICFELDAKLDEAYASDPGVI